MLSADEDSNFTGSRFTVHKDASVKIGESAVVSVSNLVIEADITGKGKLILLSDQNAVIDANNNSIENLVLSSSNKVELLSGLQIINQLTILSGELHLNDFNLLVYPNTKLDQSTLQKIIQNGKGTILQKSISIPYAALPFVLSAPLHFDFSACPSLIVENSCKPTTNIFYFQLPFILNRANEVLVPPPKA